MRLGRGAVATIGAFALVAVGVLAVAMWRGVGGAPIGETKAGFETAADFTLPDFDGTSFTLREHEDGPVFLYFWASWCKPCQEEAPVIQRAWPRYADRGYTFVGINILDREDDARAFIKRFGLTFPNVRDTDGSVYLKYGVYGVPESFLLHPGGRIETKFLGALTEEKLAELLGRIAPN